MSALDRTQWVHVPETCRFCLGLSGPTHLCRDCKGAGHLTLAGEDIACPCTPYEADSEQPTEWDPQSASVFWPTFRVLVPVVLVLFVIAQVVIR